jgi:hypothetical protein
MTICSSLSATGPVAERSSNGRIRVQVTNSSLGRGGNCGCVVDSSEQTGLLTDLVLTRFDAAIHLSESPCRTPARQSDAGIPRFRLGDFRPSGANTFVNAGRHFRNYHLMGEHLGDA